MPRNFNYAVLPAIMLCSAVYTALLVGATYVAARIGGFSSTYQIISFSFAMVLAVVVGLCVLLPYVQDSRVKLAMLSLNEHMGEAYLPTLKDKEIISLERKLTFADEAVVEIFKTLVSDEMDKYQYKIDPLKMFAAAENIAAPAGA